MMNSINNSGAPRRATITKLTTHKVIQLVARLPIRNQIALMFSIALCIVNFMQLTRPLVEPTPFAYTDAQDHVQASQVMTYPAKRSRICAGEQLDWHVWIVVNTVPTSLQSDFAIRNVVTGRSVDYGLFSDDPARPSNPFTFPTRLNVAIARTIPRTTLPGNYVYGVVVHDGVHASNGFNVPFEVLECTLTGRR